MAKCYGIVTLIGQLGWEPHWRRATPEQREFASRAAAMIKDMALALDRIQSDGTHISRGDPQLKDGTTIRSKAAVIALQALERAEEM